MSSATQSTETLFQAWRRGDAEAGKAMAQRFTDWYFAIAACRLGDEDGDARFREACTAFSRGVGKVPDPRRLLGWAHGLAREHITTAARRRDDGDLANGWTRRQPPKQILLRARAGAPQAMAVLEPAYRTGRVDDPLALLEARYALKRFIRDSLEIPFRVVPDAPDPDRAPLAFYEAGRLADENEETHVELYLLTDMEACQDVAEFAHYAIALRGGLPGEAPKPPPRPRPSTPASRTAEPAVVRPAPRTPASPEAPAPAPAPAAPETTGPATIPVVVYVVGGVALALVAVLLGLAAFLL